MLVGYLFGGVILLVVGLNYLYVVCWFVLIVFFMYVESVLFGVFGGLVLLLLLVCRLVLWMFVIFLLIINFCKVIVVVFVFEIMLRDFLFMGGGLLGLCLYVFYVVLLDFVFVLEDLFDMECCYVLMIVLVDVLYGCGDCIFNVKC